MTLPQPSPIQQLEQLLDKYRRLIARGVETLSNLPKSVQSDVYTSLVAAIERLAPPGTYYHTTLQDVLTEYGLHSSYAIPHLVGIAEALKTAYESGYLYQIEELIHADLFADFLDMAKYLLEEGYKDPAAVIIGGVLEEHLRKLCLKNSIDIIINNHYKKADMMNADLAKSNLYNRLDQKNITAWLDLRNKAAHGRYTEYTDDQVNVALLGIRDFIARFPA
jgi:hypothetical protein